MKNNIISLLAAALLGCGLFTLLNACKDEARQLEAAIEAINRQFPQEIAEGTTIDGFFNGEADGKPTVDIRVTMDENAANSDINAQRMTKMKDDLVNSFTIAARQDENLRSMFSLIAANGRTLTLTLVQKPSGKRQRVEVSPTELQDIAGSKDIPLAELQRRELERYVESQQALLPMVQGPLTCVTIEHRKTKDDNAVVWTYDVDEATINIDLLNSNLPTVKREILGTMSQPDGMSMLRTFVANGCALRYVYNGTSTGKRCEVYITTDDLRQALRNAGSTELTK